MGVLALFVGRLQLVDEENDTLSAHASTSDIVERSFGYARCGMVFYVFASVFHISDLIALHVYNQLQSKADRTTLSCIFVSCRACIETVEFNTW